MIERVSNFKLFFSVQIFFTELANNNFRVPLLRFQLQHLSSNQQTNFITTSGFSLPQKKNRTFTPMYSLSIKVWQGHNTCYFCGAKPWKTAPNLPTCHPKRKVMTFIPKRCGNGPTIHSSWARSELRIA